MFTPRVFTFQTSSAGHISDYRSPKKPNKKDTMYYNPHTKVTITRQEHLQYHISLYESRDKAKQGRVARDLAAQLPKNVAGKQSILARGMYETFYRKRVIEDAMESATEFVSHKENKWEVPECVLCEDLVSSSEHAVTACCERPLCNDCERVLNRAVLMGNDGPCPECEEKIGQILQKEQ